MFSHLQFDQRLEHVGDLSMAIVRAVQLGAMGSDDTALLG
jgi:hypothetical protein